MAPKSKVAAPGTLVLDHVGHLVPDLDAASKVLDDLGFFSTPVSYHQPAQGTANRTVMLEQGYLEILTAVNDAPNAQRVRDWMKRYDGVHLVAFGTPAATEDHVRLTAHGFSPDPLVELRRKTDLGEVGFRVIYVPPAKMPECRAQFCQHLTPELVWGSHYKKHKSGAMGLEAVYIVADDPAATAARWAEFSGVLPLPDKLGVTLRMARGEIKICSRKALSAFIDAVPPAPGVAAITLRFKDPAKFAERCRKLGFKVRKAGKRRAVSLPPALGGTWLF